MSKKVNEVVKYFEDLYKNKAIYCWGFNGEIITKELCDRCFKLYGSTTYNRSYYDNKLKEGLGKIGADCSGAMMPMSGFDTTAQNYYSKCTYKGIIKDIPRDKPCLVFKGATTASINHIGFYCGNGYVIEMKSSKDNCVKSTLDNNGWKYYAIPTWIDYNVSVSNSNFIKCVDVSSYQKDINWSQVKASGVSKAILKIISKDLKPDNKFEQNYYGCSKANVDVIGVYNYSYATTVAKAKTDALKVLEVLNGRKTKIWLDVEDECQKGLGSLLADIINAYQEVINAVGYEFGVYTGLSFCGSYIKPYETKIKCTDWWIARYYNDYNKMDISVNPNEQYKPNISRDIYGWQYSSSVQVPGINGDVDANIIYNNSSSSVSDNTQNTNSITETSIELVGKITATSLNIRSNSNTLSPIVGSYKKDDLVQLITKTSNGWYRTNKGYISGDYVMAAIGQVYNCGGLNVRSAPDSTKNNVIKSLAPSDKITILKMENGWYKAKLEDGVVGWVSDKYIQV